MTIAPTLSVNQLLQLHPAALPVLTTAGIDACCGGDLTLAAAAHGAGLTFDQLLARLEREIARPAPAQAAPSCGCERKAG
ncbi:MAG: DUF542 domain-containing protein [Gemmatimonadales bacterium]